MIKSWFEVVTSRGVTTFTFDRESAAREYCLRMKQMVPGLMIEEVTSVTTRRRVYTPRAANRSAA